MGTTVDWNRWLPPREIRDRGDLEFKVGQVWAWRDDFGSVVMRVTAERPEMHSFDAESLASNGLPRHMDTRHVHGVLVQDVGQPEPTPPDALWQDAYALPPDLCYAPDVCTSVRVMGRDEHGKAYCWKHRALWGTVTREVEDDRSIKTMFESIRKSADEIMMGVFREAGALNGRPAVFSRTRLKVGDVAMVGSDGETVRTPCTGQSGCKCGRQPVGKIVAKKGDHVIVAIGAGDFEFKAAADLALDELPDYAQPKPVTFDDPEGAFAPGTFSNLLSPMKPLTADSILEAMKSMDAIKARDAETKERYDDMVMSAFKEPIVFPYVASSYRYQPMLDDRPGSHASTKPTPKSEKEIYQLQKLNDGDRKRVELFPVIREGAPRAQSQSIAAGIGIWGTRGDAKLPPDPKPYPHVSDEDLLPDAGR